MDLSVLTQEEFDHLWLETISSFDEDIAYFSYMKKRSSEWNGKLKNETDSPID